CSRIARGNGSPLRRCRLMAQRLLIDTDVAIDYLRGQPQAADWLEAVDDDLMLSTINIAELHAGVRGGRERTALAAFVSAFEHLPSDQPIAERVGLLRRDYGKSHATGLADAVIAATAALHKAVLVTINRKHFPMLKEILVPYAK